jgi:hypothetical protein
MLVHSVIDSSHNIETKAHGDHRTPVTKRKKKLERYEPNGKPIKKKLSTVVYKGVNCNLYKCYG